MFSISEILYIVNLIIVVIGISAIMTEPSDPYGSDVPILGIFTLSLIFHTVMYFI